MLPAVRTGEVDELACGESGDELATGLGVDRGPSPASVIGRVASQEMVHSVPPFSPPMLRQPSPGLPSPSSRSPALGFLLDLGDRLGGEQVGPQVGVEDRIVPAQPLEGHRGVLLLLVAIVREHCCQALVAGGGDPLVVPVDRLELLLDRRDRPVPVDRAGRQLVTGSWSPTLFAMDHLVSCWGVGVPFSPPVRSSRS